MELAKRAFGSMDNKWIKEVLKKAEEMLNGCVNFHSSSYKDITCIFIVFRKEL